MQHIKVALADDEPLFRRGIALLLQSNKNMKVLFEVSDGNELLKKLRETDIHPHIVIMDLKMPVLNGVDATRIMQAEFPDIKVIALTSYYTKFFITNMLSGGAASYLVKSASPEELLTAINEVYKTGVYYNGHTLKAIDECLVTDQKIKSRFTDEQLTKREIEILKLICRQHNAADIAEQLFLSIRTVEGHKNNILRKTECKNTIGLIVYALLNEYITIDGLLPS